MFVIALHIWSEHQQTDVMVLVEVGFKFAFAEFANTVVLKSKLIVNYLWENRKYKTDVK